MDERLKSGIAAVIGAGNQLESAGAGVQKYGVKEMHYGQQTTTEFIIRFEMARYLMHLGVADRVITADEAKFIADYLGFSLTPDEMKEQVEKDSVLQPDFWRFIPVTFRMFADLDNSQFDPKEPAKQSWSEWLCSFYETLGREFLSCDGAAGTAEIDVFTTYVAMLREFTRTSLMKFTQAGDSRSPVQPTVPKQDGEAEKTLGVLLDELNSLTGLASVKKDVNSLINVLRIRRIREERGMQQPPMSLHLVFSGNPGTGKTTVARLLAQIYRKLGVLSRGHLMEVDRSGLVGGYVGQTAIKVQDVVDRSIGGILFIDEAYSLTSKKSENDFGHEAVEILLKAMEDHRKDLVVIVAGYPDLMEEFLTSNPGLRSRFNKFIKFEDYTPDELFGIFSGMCSKSSLRLDDEAAAYARTYFESRYLNRGKTFANGRDVRNFFEMAMVNQANRLALNADVTNEDLLRLSLSDLRDVVI